MIWKEEGLWKLVQSKEYGVDRGNGVKATPGNGMCIHVFVASRQKNGESPEIFRTSFCSVAVGRFLLEHEHEPLWKSLA